MNKFRGSSAVEQWTVNTLVAGSNPAPGAMSDCVWRPRHSHSKSRHESGGFLIADLNNGSKMVLHMIERLEIDSKAKEFEITPANVDRDYVFGWFIFGVFTISGLKDSIFLKGGNALRKGYFENTRYSTDLDFGIPDDIDSEVLLGEVNTICDFIQGKSGITFVKANNKVEEKFTASDAPIPGLRVYEVRVYFEDFYGKSEFTIKISMDITRFDKTLLPIQQVPLIHPYSDAAEVACTIRCMKLEEIIATKLKCLLQRQHAPDLFDYVYSIQLLGGSLDRDEVVRTFIQKTIFGKNPFVLKEILKQTPFDYFRNFWGKLLVCAKQVTLDVEDAIRIFLEDLEKIFSGYPNNGYRQFAYFGPELRLPIMKAGREQTLLKIRYKDSDRVVEPYSLKYLQRRDGVEREYFYVYNRSGGDNDPGIRCFVADKIQSIENTDEKFTPRCIIELCKAGEKPENPYLFDPNKPEPAPKKPRMPRVTSRIRYIYQCNYCGKKFPKTTMDSNLRAHKSKQGYPCSGRYGHYVTTKY